MNFKYFSTFAGIGGFELGIHSAIQDAECVGFSEIDKFSIQTYHKNFPNHKNYGDITTIDTANLPEFDLLVGGFPCQAFSIAGKRRGFEEARGTLFFDLARILKAKKPSMFLFENVKGLLSHDSGRTFAKIIETLTELGYCVQWQVLNSKNFGLPQNRERVFICGTRGKCTKQIFPLSGENEKTIEQLNKPKHSNDRVYSDQVISPTLNAMQGGNRQPFVCAVLTPDRAEKHQNGRRIKNNGEPSFTLTSQDKHGVLISKTVRAGGRRSPHCSKQNWDSYEVGGRIRRLTPIECARLQGFPDDWADGVSDSQQYKQFGNAVSVNAVKAIAKEIATILIELIK